VVDRQVGKRPGVVVVVALRLQVSIARRVNRRHLVCVIHQTPHREIAAAEVSHGTVRAILTRATASLNGDEPQAAEEEPAATDDIAQ